MDDRWLLDLHEPRQSPLHDATDCKTLNQALVDSPHPQDLAVGDSGREAAQVHDGRGHGPPLLGQHDGVQRDQATRRQQLRMWNYAVRFRLFS